MSHVGLLPHYVHRYGGFRTQGRTAEDALRIIDNARAIEQAGAVGLEIEAVPHEVGKAVDEAVSIFTFSIGAGSAGTCQLLNGYDLIGGFDTLTPKFAKRYGNVAEVATQAFEAFVADVRDGTFPDGEHSYAMPSVESEIVCPYHGMAYGTDGACTRIPTQSDIPGAARVRSYPLRESGAFVWIWMGEPEEIGNHDPPVDLSYTADPEWSVALGYYDVAANWILIHENVLDLTHIAHLHKSTFRQNDWNTVPEITQKGDVVTYRQEFGPAPLGPLFCHAMGFDETKPVSRVQVGTMASLAVSFSDGFVHDPAPELGAQSDFLMRGCHITTPGERGRIHYDWAAAFDIAGVPPDVVDMTRANVIAAFDEDKALLERLQERTAKYPRGVDYTEINLRADGAGLRVRRVLQGRLAGGEPVKQSRFRPILRATSSKSSSGPAACAETTADSRTGGRRQQGLEDPRGVAHPPTDRRRRLPNRAALPDLCRVSLHSPSGAPANDPGRVHDGHRGAAAGACR